MMILFSHQLVACTECRHHFVREPREHTLPCNECHGRMVVVPVQVDHRDVAGLPLAQPALEFEPDVIAA